MSCKSKTTKGKICKNIKTTGSDYCHVHKTSISKAIGDCKKAGHKLDRKIIMSPLKKETSLIGSAYLTYIYQNDIKNPHYCESMLLMSKQIGENTKNPYVHLFTVAKAKETINVLEDIQLCFDYSIGRTKAPATLVKNSVNKLKKLVG